MGVSADPARAIPILPSPDIEATKAFYTQSLGFEAIYHVAEQYLIVRRNEMEIHFWYTADRALPEVSSCYIRGGEIAALHAEFSNRGVKKLSPFEVRLWNMKEFYVHDPHGNLLRFGCAPDEM
jgi:catechol 2,3-dioxygenase-like lactoylglutathione lyase family enzyme